MKSDYAPINGLKIYYEIHSANPARVPLVLLHGGGDTIRTSFGYILPVCVPNIRFGMDAENRRGKLAT
jgi:pimeloyl-ACP methyl ester carboxylesterase